VADGGLGRAERDAARGHPVERPAQRLDLDRVADGRAGAVRLDVPDALRLGLGDEQRVADHGGLPGHAGRGEPDLARAVVVDRGPAQDGVHAAVLRPGLAEPLEHDDPDAAATDAPGGAVVERQAVPVRRVDPALLVQVPDPVRQLDRDAARQRQVALVGQQALRGQVHRDQGRGARGLHVHARTAQVQLVARGGGQEVLVVEQPGFQLVERGPQRGHDVLPQVAGHAGAREHADPGA
jgi:hypothetical protein